MLFNYFKKQTAEIKPDTILNDMLFLTSYSFHRWEHFCKELLKYTFSTQVYYFNIWTQLPVSAYLNQINYRYYYMEY